LLPGKREKPMGQGFGAPRATHRILGCVLQSFWVCIGSSCSAPNGLQIADDDRQKIIEIVGDTTGDLPDGFHLLCLTRPLVCCAPFGQVTRHLRKAYEFAVAIADRIDYDSGPEPRSVLALTPSFRVKFALTDSDATIAQPHDWLVVCVI
jgi:hypothetical protein